MCIYIILCSITPVPYPLLVAGLQLPILLAPIAGGLCVNFTGLVSLGEVGVAVAYGMLAATLSRVLIGRWLALLLWVVSDTQ